MNFECNKTCKTFGYITAGLTAVVTCWYGYQYFFTTKSVDVSSISVDTSSSAPVTPSQ